MSASTTALATVEQVEARLEGEVTDDMRRMIAEYLEDASDQARYYGASWTQSNCPMPVSRLVANTVARFIRNPDSFVQNRASDETLGWQDLPEEYVGTVYFTAPEIERLQNFGNPRLPKFGTIQMIAHSDAPHTFGDIHWMVSGSQKPFPLFVGGAV